MRLLLIGDVHLSDTPPSVRTETYADDILNKLDWCVDYANSNYVDGIVQLGDMFHIKTPSRTSHHLVQRTAKVFERALCPVFIVPGNHDLRNNRIGSIPSQPLGTLALSPNVHLIDGWVQTETVSIYGIPYTEDRQVFETGLGEAVAVDALLITTHASIFPPGFHPPYPYWSADSLGTHGIPLAYGHIHEPHGFYMANGAWFCNNGAISRGSLHQETLNRKLKVTLFDSSTPGKPFIDIPIPFRPAEEVFKLTEHQVKQDKSARLDDFLNSVQGVSLSALSVEEVVNHVETSDLLDSTAVQEMKEIIETVS